MGDILDTKLKSELAIGFSAIIVIGLCIMHKIRAPFIWGEIFDLGLGLGLVYAPTDLSHYSSES